MNALKSMMEATAPGYGDGAEAADPRQNSSSSAMSS